MPKTIDAFRRPRKNPEIPFLVRLIREKTAELARETDYPRRKGHARVLIEHLEALDVEPEFLYDLMEGPAELRDAYFRPDEFEAGRVALTDETPFDHPGKTAGRFFFHSRRISHLLAGEAIDPYTLSRPFSSMGWWNLCVEKRYASAQPTTMRVSGPEIFTKALGKRKPSGPGPGKWAYLVVADPRGEQSGRTAHLVAHTTDQSQAIRLADRLGDLLEIRFVVARTVYAFLNH